MDPREFIATKGWSVREVQRRTGLKYSTLANYLAGGQKAGPEVLSKLEELLGIGELDARLEPKGKGLGTKEPRVTVGAREVKDAVNYVEPWPKRTRVDGVTLGQELLDLQRAKEAGVITEKEFERLKERLIRE